jgi:hypothetical protein
MYYYYFLITVIFPIQNQYKSYLIKKLHALFTHKSSLKVPVYGHLKSLFLLICNP